MAEAQRKIQQVITSTRTLEGGGFPVRRPFPTAELGMIDPFLLLDHFGPVEWGPGEAIGAPDHPHRGFETVTYMLSGHFQHKDSHGHVADLAPGDVQWMTAGAGIVHSEMPAPDFLASGGVVDGVQLWLNLPAAKKMSKPRYQDLPASSIPQAHSDDGLVSAKVIAGECMGVHSSIDTHTPIIYLHFSLKPGAKVTQAVPADHNCFAFVLSGAVHLGSNDVQALAGQLGLFADGDSVSLQNRSKQNAEVLLLAGRPLNEPVARYGPFVMNTSEEIHQAFDDYRQGRMGEIAAD